MKLTVFSTKPYDRRFFEAENHDGSVEIVYHEARLFADTAPLAKGSDAVCVFVNDQVDADTISALAKEGVRGIVLRCAGFNNVDLAAARDAGIRVLRVPAYSPNAVAEHALALILSLNRKIHRAHNRVREGNFSLDGLLGFDLRGKTVGILGTGQIGIEFARILQGFGLTILGYDPYKNEEFEKLNGEYTSLEELFTQSDIISLHCPLMKETFHLIDAKAISKMKPGVMVINTSRGALVDTEALIQGLKSQKIGYLGLDVYEEEADLFFEDLSDTIISDDVFARLLTFPNVLITGHQAFFTSNAVSQIARTTFNNLSSIEKEEDSDNEVFPS